jgi:hypothetical protein
MDFLKSFSVWVFGLVLAWYVGLVKFSPLLAILINLVLTFVFVRREYDFQMNGIALLIILIHAKPAYVLRHHPINLPETLLFLLVYNVFLWTQGTTMIKEYSTVYNKPVKSVRDFISQG